MKKWFFLSFFFFISFVFAHEDPYVFRIAKVELQENDSTVSGVITLDNGSCWETTVCTHCAKKLALWEEGHLVSLNKCSDAYFHLKDSELNNLTVHAKLDRETQNAFPTIQEVDEVGTSILLSDGSTWELGWWSASAGQHWEVGDAIIPIAQSPWIGSASHALYNVNRQRGCMSDSSYVNATWMNPTH